MEYYGRNCHMQIQLQVGIQSSHFGDDKWNSRDISLMFDLAFQPNHLIVDEKQLTDWLPSSEKGPFPVTVLIRAT